MKWNSQSLQRFLFPSVVNAIPSSQTLIIFFGKLYKFDKTRRIEFIIGKIHWTAIYLLDDEDGTTIELIESIKSILLKSDISKIKKFETTAHTNA